MPALTYQFCFSSMAETMTRFLHFFFLFLTALSLMSWFGALFLCLSLSFSLSLSIYLSLSAFLVYFRVVYLVFSLFVSSILFFSFLFFFFICLFFSSFYSFFCSPKGMPNILYEGIFQANYSNVVVVTIAYRLGPYLNNYTKRKKEKKKKH